MKECCGNLRVLVVDDDKNFLNLLLPEILKYIGIKQEHVLKVTGAEEAIVVLSGLLIDNMVMREPRVVDLIISDWKMPVTDGILFYDILKKNYYLRNIPFILMSADYGKKTRRIAANAGIKNFIYKGRIKETIKEASNNAIILN